VILTSFNLRVKSFLHLKIQKKGVLVRNFVFYTINLNNVLKLQLNEKEKLHNG